MFTRERHRPGVWYFGPYANAKKVRETLDVLNRVFRYRPCEGPKPGRHSGIPCLDYHIDRCLAPCVGYVSQEEYRRIVDGVIESLSGDVKPLQRQLEQQRQEAARDGRLDDAARYLHLPLELALDRLHGAREKLDHAVDDAAVLLLRDVADAPREAAVEVVVETRDAAVATWLRPLARPIAEDAVEH